ncbi:MAG TPA: hypothetical protein VNE41_12580 [Chitinophagaceae bacterium]|nr:hypothetical protein [Chitinophagaceae bacterium]
MSDLLQQFPVPDIILVAPTDGWVKIPAIDSIGSFIKKDLYYISLINLSFCQKELIKILNNNDRCRNDWKQKIKNYFTMYNKPIGYISSGKEIQFFKDRLLENKRF